MATQKELTQPRRANKVRPSPLPWLLVAASIAVLALWLARRGGSKCISSERVLYGDNIVIPSANGGLVVKQGYVHMKQGSILSVVEATLEETKRFANNGKIPLEVYENPHIVSPGFIELNGDVLGAGRSSRSVRQESQRAAAAGITLSIEQSARNVNEMREQIASVSGSSCIDVGYTASIHPDNAAQPGLFQDLARAGALSFRSSLSPSSCGESVKIETMWMQEGLLHEVADVLSSIGLKWMIGVDMASESSVREYVQRHGNRNPSWELQGAKALEELSLNFPRLPIVAWGVSNVNALKALQKTRTKGRSTSFSTAVMSTHMTQCQAENVTRIDTKSDSYCFPLRSCTDRRDLCRAVSTMEETEGNAMFSPPRAGNAETIWIGPIETSTALRDSALYGHKNGAVGVSTLSEDIIRSLAKDMAMLWSSEPSKILNLADNKGQLSQGFDADIVVWNPTKTWEKDGRLYYGRVARTYVRGMLVFGGDDGPPACGRRVTSHR